MKTKHLVHDSESGSLVADELDDQDWEFVKLDGLWIRFSSLEDEWINNKKFDTIFEIEMKISSNNSI